MAYCLTVRNAISQDTQQERIEQPQDLNPHIEVSFDVIMWARSQLPDFGPSMKAPSQRQTKPRTVRPSSQRDGASGCAYGA